MPNFKKILIAATIVVLLSAPCYAKETVASMDDMNIQSLILDKQIELTKKQVSLEKAKNELIEAKKGNIKVPEQKPLDLFSAPPNISQRGYNIKEVKESPYIPIVIPDPVSKPVKKKSDTNFTETEIASMPHVSGVMGFGKKREAVLIFPNKREQKISKGNFFMVGSIKYTVSNISIDGVTIYKGKKGQSILLGFVHPLEVVTSKKTDKSPSINSPVFNNFPLDSTMPPSIFP